MDKKISLEHVIKNIVRESIGGANTDKFKGTPKAFLQPAPHIEPKVGDTHPDASAAVAKRGNAKIRTSETMKEEEEISEDSSEPGWQPKKKSIGDFAFDKIRKAKSDAAQWKAGSEAAKKGQTLSTYKELPSEWLRHKVSSGIEAISGDPDKAERSTKFFAKIPSQIPGVDVAVNAIDAAAAMYQGRTASAAQKATEAGREAALLAAGGVIGNKVARFATNPEVTTAGANAIKDIKPPSFFGPQKTKPPVPEVSTPKPETPKTSTVSQLKPETPKIEPTKTVNKTISDIMKRPDLGDVGNINKPKLAEPQTAKPEKVEPAPATQKTTKDKTSNDQETFDFKQQGNLKLKPKRDQADIPPTPEKNSELEKIFKKQPKNIEAPANVNVKPMKPKDIGKDTPKLDEPANNNTKKPSNDNAAPKVNSVPNTKQAKSPALNPNAQVAPAPATAAQPAPAPAPATAAQPAPAPAPATAAQPAPAPQKKPDEKKGEEEKKRRRIGGMPSFGVKDMTVAGMTGNVPFSQYVHRAADRVSFGESYIKNQNRKAQIKMKIIDENAEKIKVIKKVVDEKKNSTIILNPKLKNPEADQN